MKKKFMFSLVGVIFAAVLWLNPILSYSEGLSWDEIYQAVSGGDASGSVSGGDSSGSEEDSNIPGADEDIPGTDEGDDGSVSGGDASNPDEGGDGSVSGGDASNPDEGGDTPGEDEGGDVPGGDEGGNTPGEDEGGDTPGEDEGGDTPGEDEGGETPDEGGNAGGEEDSEDVYVEEVPDEVVDDALAEEGVGEEVKVNTDDGEVTLVKDAKVDIVQTAKQVIEEVINTPEVQDALNKIKDIIVNNVPEAVVEVIAAIDIDITTFYKDAMTNEEYTGDANYGKESITQLPEGKKLSFTVKVPKNAYDPNAKYNVVRHHENEDGSISAEVLETTQNGDELTFSSDKFSTFVIVKASEKKDPAPTPTPNPPAEPEDTEEEEDEEEAPAAAQTVVTNVTYVVQSGDNLSKIAAQHGISLGRLLALNPQIKNPNLIYKGQIIIIDVKTTTVGADAGQGSVANAEYYVVVKGDCLWNIARRYNLRVNDLYIMNEWLLNQKYIYAGQRIRVK